MTVCTTTEALISPQPTVLNLLMRPIPQTSWVNPNNTTTNPPTCVSIQQAAIVSTEAQVIHLFVHHHGSSNHGQPSEQRSLRFHYQVDLSFLGLKVPKVPRVVWMMHITWVVVATGGFTFLAQVTVLVDVHGSVRLWSDICGETFEPEDDIEFSVRVILFEQHMAVHSGHAVRQ